MHTLHLTASFATLRSIITVELLGLEKLTSAFGLLLLFQGMAVTIGSPIAGKCVAWCLSTRGQNLPGRLSDFSGILQVGFSIWLVHMITLSTWPDLWSRFLVLCAIHWMQLLVGRKGTLGKPKIEWGRMIAGRRITHVTYFFLSYTSSWSCLSHIIKCSMFPSGHLNVIYKYI